MSIDIKTRGVSARTMLARQTGQEESEEPAASGIDIGSFMLDVVTDQNLSSNISELTTSGSITRTMDGASHIDASVRDANRAILRSGILSKTIDLTLDTRQFRLAQNQKQGPQLGMTFEDKIIAQLRDLDDTKTASRGKMTRAQFIKMLVKTIKTDGGIRFFSPELDKIQPIAGVKDDRVTKSKKHPGLEKSELLRVGGAIANKQQVDTAERILNQGYHLKANRKVNIAAIMTAEDECGLINVQHGDAAGPDSIGVFQQRDSWGPVSERKTIEGASKLWYKVAIEIDKDHPDWKLWELCTAVQFPAYRSKSTGQIPDFGKRYDKFKNEAKEFVSEYGAEGGDTSITRRQQYQFTVGPPDGPKGENYWEAIVRLAGDVQWRAFVSNNTFYYASDDYLIKQKPRYTIDEDTPGVEAIDFDVDKGKVNDECTVTCRADRWTAPAGSVIVIQNCGSANGKWLVWEIERQIASYDATITLHRKQAKKKEPAPDIETVASDGSDEGIVVGTRVVTGDKIRDRIVTAAKRALRDESRYHYSHWRPESGKKWPSLYSKATHDHGLDCSAFVEMVYMAAGAQDPNGLGYFGGGYTGSQQQNGTKTAHPLPGDLVFYGPGIGPNGSPGHVAIYIGSGQVIEVGGDPCPRQLDVNYRNDIIGYWTYRLAKHTPSPNLDPGGNPGRLGR